MLTPARLAREHSTMVASCRFCPVVAHLRCYTSTEAALRNACTTTPELTRVFRVDLAMGSLARGRQLVDRWTLQFDLSAPTCPDTAPVVHAVGEIPLSPHFRSPDGLMCLGTVWQPSMLAAHVLAEAIRVLNFELTLGPGEEHYSADAVAWWEDRGRASIDPELPQLTVVTPEMSTAVAASLVFGSVSSLSADAVTRTSR